jgi:hypothetical protein
MRAIFSGRLSQWAGRLGGSRRRKPTPEEKQAEKERLRREGVAICMEEATPRETAGRVAQPHLIWLRKGGRIADRFTQRAVTAMLREPRAGMVFGRSDHPPLLRRDALLQAGGFAETDAATWAAIAALGWRAIDLHGRDFPLPPLAGPDLLAAPATLFLSLSGRGWAWPLTAKFLEQQTFPHRQTHLHVLDTSQDAAFGDAVRAWLARCDYAGTSWTAARVGPRGIADLPRPEALDAVRHAVGAIYNRFARACATPLALFLEDDVLPPVDAYARLVQHFGDRTLCVSGVVNGRHERYRRGAPIAWRWRADGAREDLVRSAGVEPVGGTGFGCLAMRGDYLRGQVFRSGPPLNDFDFNFFHDATIGGGREALIDWDCVCRHYDGPDSWI